MRYLGEPIFWVSVLVVAFVLNFVWMKFLGGKGNIA